MEAIRNGISALTWQTDTFAYAAAFDSGKNRYLGLVAGQQADVVLDASAVIVKPDAAAAQLEAEAKSSAETTTTGAGGITADGGDGAGGEPETAPDPRRFYGRVTLGPVRLLRGHRPDRRSSDRSLNRPDGSNVRITVEIEADATSGFSEDLRRTVTENARTLKFESSEFET